MLKFSLKTAAILSLSSCLLLSGCGLKSGLYLPQAPSHASVPVESTPIKRTDDAAPEQSLAKGESSEPAARVQH